MVDSKATVGLAAKQLYEAQTDIVGAILIDPSIAGEVILECSEADFTDPTIRAVYQAIKEVFSAGAALDVVAVRHKLGEPYAPVLMDIMRSAVTSADWRAHARILREQAAVYRLQLLGAKLMGAVGYDEAAELAGQVSKELCQRQGVEAVSFFDGLSAFFDRHEAGKDNKNYLTWGFSQLNDKLFIAAGGFVILGGRPSSGKTMLACSFALHQALHEGKRVGIFSLETSAADLYDRIVCRASGVDFAEIKRSNLSGESWQQVAELGDLTDTIQLDVIEASSMTVEDIRAYAVSRRYEVIYIDYLQLIVSGGRRGNRVEEVSDISMGLHRLAQDTGITVVALSQLSRGEKGSKGKPPDLDSLRESGQLEQDADAVMLLYSTDPDTPGSDRNLRIAKNKNGGVGYLALTFDPKHMRFTPKSGRTDEPVRRRSEPQLKLPAFTETNEKTPFEEGFNDEEKAKTSA